MKKRQSFVSNSSSSSFIINEGDIKTFSKAMLKIVIEDWTEWDSDGRTKHKKLYDKWRANLKKPFTKSFTKQYGPVGVKLPSTNEDTYLFEKDGKLYIDTCRNHDWNEIDGFAFAQYIPEEGSNGIAKLHSFFDVRLGKVVNPIIKNDRECPRCSYDEVHPAEDGKKYCIICNEEVVSVLARAGKA